MIVEQFDRRTLAAMEVALDKVCGCWPQGGTHSLRKRVAQGIIRCAKSGNTGLDALTEAGQRAAEPRRGRTPSRLDRPEDTRPDFQNAA
jgi:hypothetical protein